MKESRITLILKSTHFCKRSQGNDLLTALTWPTDINGVVGHHVFVVVEPVLKVVAAFLVTEKPLQKHIISQNQLVWLL